MRISIKSCPTIDRHGDLVECTTVEIDGDSNEDVAKKYKEVMKELEEDK